MRAEDIILQLLDKIPSLTDKFTVDVGITNIKSVCNQVVVTCDEAHNLIVGDLINIHDVDVPLSIANMTRSGTIISCETNESHDLTENYQETVTIRNATEDEFNGTFKLLKVPNRKNFTLETVDSGATVATGSPEALNIDGSLINGLHTVKQIIADTVFLFESTTELDAEITNGNCTVEFRISGAATLDRAIDSYTKYGDDEYWAFVVLGVVVASKDRNVNSDAIAIMNGGLEWKQQVIFPYTIYIMAPASGDISGREISDNVRDVVPFMFQSILGAAFDSGLAESQYYYSVFDRHGPINYNGPVYIHGIDFQSLATLTFGDTIGEPRNVAFRDINLSVATNIMNDDTRELEVLIDLDEEPLS